MPNSLRDIFKYYIWTTSAVCPAVSLNNCARVSLSTYAPVTFTISPEIVCKKKKNDQVSHTLFGPIANTVGKLRTAHGVVTYFAIHRDPTRKRVFVFQIYSAENRTDTPLELLKSVGRPLQKTFSRSPYEPSRPPCHWIRLHSRTFDVKAGTVDYSCSRDVKTITYFPEWTRRMRAPTTAWKRAFYSINFHFLRFP